MIPFPKEGFLGIVLGMHVTRHKHGTRAHLQGAHLQGANLCGANLCGAHLQVADLCGANLCGANLLRASLWGANLQDADLQGAHLRGAHLRDADLCDAHLRGADLRGADLKRIVGQGSAQMVCLQVEPWAVVMTPDQMAIGCEQYAVADWWGFDDDRIARMDKKALEWWRTWKPALQQVYANAFGDSDQ